MPLRSFRVPVLLFAVACQSPPAPAPEPMPMAAASAAAIAPETRLLLAMYTQQALASGPEAAGMTELTARLAGLNDRLDQLLARLPAAASGVAVDAAASRAAAAPVAGADAEAIEVLQQALRVVERQRQVCLENLANVNTPGYRRQQLRITTTRHASSGLAVPAVACAEPGGGPGTLEATDRVLDVAIDGEGYFLATGAEGPWWTRNGSLHVAPDGSLVTAEGWPLVPHITVPPDALEIAIDPVGLITARCAGAPEQRTRLGELRLAHGSGTDGPPPGGGASASGRDEPVFGTPGSLGLGYLKQGFLERSNVTVLDELVALQLADRQRTVLCRVLAGYGIYVR